MKSKIAKILVSIYLLVVVFITGCLLSFNEYNVSKFGKTSLVIVEEKLGTFNKGDLLISSSKNINKIKKGDIILYYNDLKNDYKIEKGEVTNFNKNKEVFYLEKASVPSNHIIGLIKDTSCITKIGFIMKILESKLGYLLIVVMPILLAFLYELFNVRKEIKTLKTK